MQKELVSKILKKVSKSTRKVYEGKFDEKKSLSGDICIDL